MTNHYPVFIQICLNIFIQINEITYENTCSEPATLSHSTTRRRSAFPRKAETTLPELI